MGVVDRDRRREEVASAVWRVLDQRGFVGLSVRAVATEMGATTGTVTHYFPSKRELTTFALDLLDRRSSGRARRSADDATRALVAALLDMLPLDQESGVSTRIWIGSWDAALADDEHAAAHARRYATSRTKVLGLVRAALRDRGADEGGADHAAEVLHGLALGLAVQAVLDPAAYPASRQAGLIESAVARLLPLQSA